MFLHPLPITEQGHTMITPTHSELVTVDRADIERIHHALIDLWNSASTEGCEEPYGVIDMTHLNTLKSVFLPLRLMLEGASDTPAAQRNADDAKRVVVVVEAFETSEYGADGPLFASFDVTLAMLDKIHAMVGDMQTRGIVSGTLRDCPEWGPGDCDIELRLRDPLLNVNSLGDLWFSDYPKSGSYEIESRAVSLADLRRLFDTSEHLSTQFIAGSGDTQALAAMYWQDECQKALGSLPAGEEPDPDSTTPQQLRYARALAAVEALAADDDKGDDVTPVSPASN